MSTWAAATEAQHDRSIQGPTSRTELDGWFMWEPRPKEQGSPPQLQPPVGLARDSHPLALPCCDREALSHPSWTGPVALPLMWLLP